MLSWLKKLFGKKKQAPDFSNYDRIQEILMQQELLLLKQEMPQPSRKRRTIWTQEMIAEWRENARMVDELYRRTRAA